MKIKTKYNIGDTVKYLEEDIINEGVCECCNSNGFVKSPTTISFETLQNFKDTAIRENITGTVTLSVSNKVFDHIVHHEYSSILSLEKQLHCKIILESSETLEASQFKIDQLNSNI